MAGTPVRTAALWLCEPTMRDLAEVHALHADPETNVHNPAGPATDPARSAASLREWIEHFRLTGVGYWVVREAAPSTSGIGEEPDGPLVGICGVRRTDLDGEPVLNLYYRFTPAVWGRGYATEAARAALEVAAQRLPEHPVVALVRPTNVTSSRVARRLGMVHVGTVDYHGAPTEVYRLERPGS